MNEYSAYLFVHFVGEKNENGEQIYFSVSKDAVEWETLNLGKPVLKSTLGEKGVRDPHIVRSPENDKFYLIATDLSIYNRRDDKNCWHSCETSGSRSIMVWESSNLVNWSEQRMVKIAAEDAGCTWAPESIWDNEKNAYMVFWASRTAFDGFKKQRIYRSYTKDFVNFDSPEIYIERDSDVIDSTIIFEDGMYYRYSKDETKKAVICETSDNLSGEWKLQKLFEPIVGVEGPTIFKYNDREEWCLMVDFYSRQTGYLPYTASDIAVGRFIKKSDTVINISNLIMRHGTVIPITLEEYNLLKKSY